MGVEEGGRTRGFPRLAISGAIVYVREPGHGRLLRRSPRALHPDRAITPGRWNGTRDGPAAPQSDNITRKNHLGSGWASCWPAGGRATCRPCNRSCCCRWPVSTGSRSACGRRSASTWSRARRWIWVGAASAEDTAPDRRTFEAAGNSDVRIGFERTLDKDVAVGIRQLIDIASKALSPAINDPYTAVQAIDHLSAVCADLALQPLGTATVTDASARGAVIVPGNTFADYIFFICGLVGRYGARDMTVLMAMLRLLRTCAFMVGDDEARLRTLDEAGQHLLEDAEREMARPAVLETVRKAVDSLHRRLDS